MFQKKIAAQILGGCLQDFPNRMSGNYRGFYVTIQPAEGEYVVKIAAHLESDPQNAGLHHYFALYEQQTKEIKGIAVNNGAIIVTIKAASFAKKVPDLINRLLDPIFNYLQTSGYQSGCESCGNSDVPPVCYEVNGVAFHLCQNCKNQVEVDLQNHKTAQKNRKAKFVPGLVGAFIGALIGAALWILIYRLGYIAGIAGAVTAICAMKGYEMLGGHLDKRGVIGSVIIMVLVIFFANKISWAWEAYDALADYDWTFSECYRQLSYILTETETTGSYYGDLVIGYVLTIVCCIKPIVSAFKASRGEYSITQ